jgi:hypothetical protein
MHARACPLHHQTLDLTWSPSRRVPCTAGDNQLLRVERTAASSACRDTCSPAIRSSATDTGYGFKSECSVLSYLTYRGVHAGS